MFCFYKRRRRDNFLAECAISHCREGMCALPAKDLTPMPLGNQCCLVRDGECVDTKSKDRVSYCKLLESSLTLTNTETPRCHFRTRYGMDE